MVREREAALEQAARRQARRHDARVISRLVGTLLATAALVLLGGSTRAMGLVP